MALSQKFYNSSGEENIVFFFYSKQIFQIVHLLIGKLRMLSHLQFVKYIIAWNNNINQKETQKGKP